MAALPVPVRVRILDRLPIGGEDASGGGGGSPADGDEGSSGDGQRDGLAPIGGGGAAPTHRRRHRRLKHRRDDEHATAYLSATALAALLARWGGSSGGGGGEEEEGNNGAGRTLGRLVRIIGGGDGEGWNSEGADATFEGERSGGGRMRLWAPLILKALPSSDAFPAPPDTSTTDTSTPLTLHVPPCLAATLGLHPFHRGPSLPSAAAAVYLGPLPRHRLVQASRATLRELGVPPPAPRLRWPPARDSGGAGGNESGGSSGKGGKDGGEGREEEGRTTNASAAERELRRFFLRPPPCNDDDDDDDDGEERQLHPAFRTKRRDPQRPRRRLLARGSIFAVPSYDDEDNADGGSARYWEGADEGRRVPRDVRFYQVVDVAAASPPAGSDGGKVADDDDAEDVAYVVAPSTHLTLLPADGASHRTALHPQLEEWGAGDRAWRLPRPSMARSFLRFVASPAFPAPASVPSAPSLLPPSTEGGATHRDANGWTPRHPSARVVADALYLLGAVPSPPSISAGRCGACHRAAGALTASPLPMTDEDLRIIHVAGREEDDLRACVDEAADIVGMRCFHVDGLAAFWAHSHRLGTYDSPAFSSSSSHPPSTQPLTGGLADKLRGLRAAVSLARRSAPCVLRLSLEGELSSVEGPAADAEARREEEQRMLEALREGLATTAAAGHPPSIHRREPKTTAGASTDGRAVHDVFLSTAAAPPVAVVLSAPAALPPGPLASALPHRRIDILPPDAGYARRLWDDDADGTFEAVARCLAGLSAREVRWLRGRFAALWRAEVAAKGDEGGMAATVDEESAPPTDEPRPSPVAVLQSLLPELEASRTFARSANKGGASTLPLAASALPNVRWEDIGGLDAIRREITDAVELPLKHPALFEGSRRSGILLFGPPGTGKTLVAKAVARECGLPFLSVKGPELLGSYVGESEANVRAVFAAARSAAADAGGSLPWGGDSNESNDNDAPTYAGAAVLFFDELDSLAPRRGDTGHGDGVMDRVSATLLGELDGGGDERHSANVVVIGATNRPDLLDPSLLRPGRFDRLLYLGPAQTKEHCLQILLAQTRHFRFADGETAAVVLEQAMASFPSALSGADLSAVASGALMRGLRRVCERVEEEARAMNQQRSAEGAPPVDVDDVMDAWSDDDLRPALTAADFVAAARDVVPSIGAKDLEGFERLQRQFSSGRYS